MSQNKIHQEIMRFVTPFSRISIHTDLFVKIRPVDVFEYPSGDAFIAELHGDIVKNCTASMNVAVSEDEKEVNVSLKKLDPNSTFHCEIEVPIRADLFIHSKNAVNIFNIQSENVYVDALKGISGKDIRSENINLYSENGSIHIKGLLLGKTTYVETKSSGVRISKITIIDTI